MLKNLFFILSLLLLSSCTSQYYKPLPKEFATQERIDKAKGFAEQLFNKCNNQDYSEIQGYDIDASMKRRLLTSEKLEKFCFAISEKFGKVTIGEFYSANTVSRPIDIDYFTFNAKSEKKDSLKFFIVSLYRDKDFISGINTAYSPKPKIRIRYIQ